MFRTLRSFLVVLLMSGATLGAAGPGLADDANPDALVGHWRKTTIQHLGPHDEHLVLGEDGTMTDFSNGASLWRVAGRRQYPDHQRRRAGHGVAALHVL